MTFLKPEDGGPVYDPMAIPYNYKYCEQEFWSFISGNENLYIDIIESGKKTKRRIPKQKNFPTHIAMIMEKSIGRKL
ncbi:MAG: hypothetical protein LBE36_05625 [Flavobacteriaceae bacterium]|jgi:hypothetical protein|nr:hypothetical protein [Flavobacteriaceae bacterium]